MPSQTTRPERQIRRFDIFAEWNRLKGHEKLNLSEAKARAYGLAVAKIVAARKFGNYEPGQVKDWKRKARQDDVSEAWWEHLGSDKEFDDKIIHRMGEHFYRHVFQPAIREAWDEGKDYEEIRDSLREAWNAHLAAARKPRSSG
ncbi:MAG: hypothetical protein M3347_18860 [Armatimonadota bacterium]|nr:hypothetical protein [Armatimonadota bacterium]